jgi:lipid A 3-O-deacylase
VNLGKLRSCVLARIVSSCALLIVIACLRAAAFAQQENFGTSSSDDLAESTAPIHRSWQIGGFVAGGFVPTYYVSTPNSTLTVELNFVNSGLQVGRLQATSHGPSILRGRGEAALEVIPFWLAQYPRQLQSVHLTEFPQEQVSSYFGPYSRYGASVTPFLLRWNFMQRDSSRVVPWVQLGGGLLWTNHKFPLLGGDTSVINFTPQVGVTGDN